MPRRDDEPWPDLEREGVNVPPSDDHSGGGGDPLSGAFALAALIVSAGVTYARDLRAAVEQLLGRGGLEAALREEHVRVKARVIAIAAIADGTITPAERSVIAELAAREGIDIEDVLANVASFAERLRDPAALRETIARCAAPLTADERLEAFVVVKNLSHRGSAAWPDASGYRGAAAPTPEGLIAAFRAGLGIQSTDA